MRSIMRSGASTINGHAKSAFCGKRVLRKMRSTGSAPNILTLATKRVACLIVQHVAVFIFIHNIIYKKIQKQTERW